jgi:hypothetical protein
MAFDKTRLVKASPVFQAPTVPMGYQQIASATLASATALTVPAGSLYAVIENNGSAAVRWRDTADPTSTTGGRVLPGDTLSYDGDLTAVKFIREGAGAVLDVNFYR